MNEQFVKQCIEKAKNIVNKEQDYKAEILTAVLTASLIREEITQAGVKQTTTGQAGAARLEKKISVREFLMTNQPRNDVEKTATFAYYMEFYEGKKSFTNKDVVNCFRDSKEPVPSNPADKIQKCVAKGWLTKGEEKSTYSITNTGIKAVENCFKEE